MEKVKYSQWAALVVPVPKEDEQLSFCSDYMVTINHALETEQYPASYAQRHICHLGRRKGLI